MSDGAAGAGAGAGRGVGDWGIGGRVEIVADGFAPRIRDCFFEIRFTVLCVLV